MKVLARIVIFLFVVNFWKVNAQDSTKIELDISSEQIENNLNAEFVEEELSNFDFKAYVSNFHTARYSVSNQQLSTVNSLQNRLNFRYFPLEELNIVLELRNRLLWSESYLDLKGAEALLTNENGIIDLSYAYSNKKNYLLQTAVDRIYLDYNKNDWQIRIGRQRINWGQTYVWNPNDIFNPYSYLDFDYEERPGKDAILLKHYFDESTSMQFASDFESDGRQRTIAMLFKTNYAEYDMQLLLGKMRNYYVLGSGFSGQLFTAGLKGELSYFKSTSEVELNDNILATLSADYTFPNSLYFQTELIYNKENLPDANISAASREGTIGLGFGNISIFFQISYQLSALSRVSLSSIQNIEKSMLILIPNITFSLSDNAEFSFIAQISRIPSSDIEEMRKVNSFSGRIKYSF